MAADAAEYSCGSCLLARLSTLASLLRPKLASSIAVRLDLNKEDEPGCFVHLCNCVRLHSPETSYGDL